MKILSNVTVNSVRLKGAGMDLGEVVQFLGWKREEVLDAIKNGIALPKSKTNTFLKANELAKNTFDIEESVLDEFIALFEAEEPGRHPPIPVCRELLVEAKHKCGICGQSAPRLHFHHMVEWSSIKHHDPKNMLAICGTCHDKCSNGEINHLAQRAYKAKLSSIVENEDIWGDIGLDISWDQLKDVVLGIRDIVCTQRSKETDSRYDLSLIDIESKNEKNNVSESYFEMMKSEHEPLFTEIESFLESPDNEDVKEAYLEVTDEIRTTLAANQTSKKPLEVFLIDIQRKAKALSDNSQQKNGRVLNALLSYMYFCCDIGRK